MTSSPGLCGLCRLQAHHGVLQKMTDDGELNNTGPQHYVQAGQ